MATDNQINPAELRALINQQPAPLVVDIRSSDQYAAGHIPGARNIPREELLQVLMDPPINREVVVYCNMEHPGRSGSEQAADLLREKGYSAWVLAGGLPAWKAAGFSMENGYNGYGELHKPIV